MVNGIPIMESAFSPDSPDEMALGQLRAPISIGGSNSYAGSSSQILTDPTGERRSRRFRQHFRGLRSCRPNPSGESGVNRVGQEIIHRRVDWGLPQQLMLP